MDNFVTKKQFYDKKENEYPEVDLEAILRYQRAIDFVKIDPGAKILDIGCKYATLKNMLLNDKIETDYYGVDISAKVFHKIKNFNPEKFFIADASKELPFEKEKFDYVFALEIIEHVESPTNMLNEIHRVLKNSGVLVLSVPNVYCWNEIVGNLKKMQDTEGHISAFTFQIMERLLKFTNFEVEDIRGTYWRVPFSRRVLKTRYFLLKTNNLFLTRSFIYKAKKQIKMV